MSLSRLISNPAPKAFGHGALLATAGLAFGLAAAPPALSAEIIFDLTNDPPTPIPTNNFTFTQSGVELTINVLGSTLSGNSNTRGVCAYSSMPGCGDGGKATATPQRTLTGLDFSFTTPVELVSYEIERIRVAASDVGVMLDQQYLALVGHPTSTG